MMSIHHLPALSPKRRSKCGTQVSRWANSNRHSVASHTLSPSFAGTLELKTEKQNAHSGTIWSVGFNKDGSQIVSGSSDKTIKVWDSGASNGHS